MVSSTASAPTVRSAAMKASAMRGERPESVTTATASPGLTSRAWRTTSVAVR